MNTKKIKRLKELSIISDAWRRNGYYITVMMALSSSGKAGQDRLLKSLQSRRIEI